ncbi:MAG: DUF2281 domain-containing protein [Magnetococcales bacterium]|nr:DUF2281 domain-containing protein [Magnetococcales bacterium]
MGYTELLTRLQTLPPEKQAEVFDFVEFLAARYSNPSDEPQVVGGGKSSDKTTGEFSGPLAALRARGATQYGDVQPMSREELYDRPLLC